MSLGELSFEMSSPRDHQTATELMNEQMLKIRSSNLYKKFFAGMWKMRSNPHKKQLQLKKREIMEGLSGELLEIGAGTGSNFKILSSLGCRVLYTAIEPNIFMHDHLHYKAEKYEIPVETILSADAARLPIPDSSFDVVLCTHVLSSVMDVDAVLKEVVRVLKPQGKFIFVENVAAPPHSKMRTVQNIITPLSRAIADGYEYNRELWKNIEAVAEFESVQFSDFEWNNIPQIYGVAVKHVSSQVVSQQRT